MQATFNASFESQNNRFVSFLAMNNPFEYPSLVQFFLEPFFHPFSFIFQVRFPPPSIGKNFTFSAVKIESGTEAGGHAKKESRIGTGEILRERRKTRWNGHATEREETMNEGVICNGISWQQWRIVCRDVRIVAVDGHYRRTLRFRRAVTSLSRQKTCQPA